MKLKELSFGFGEAAYQIERCRTEGATTLDLSSLGLPSLPPDIFTLTWLKELNISRNHLETLPDAIGALTALTWLDVGGNQLQTLPTAIGSLVALTSLKISGNQLETLPAAIGNLTALTRLDVGGNQFRTLPEAIGNLTALMQLSVGANQLRALPQTIGNLTTLTRFDARWNQLETLPTAISNLTALKQLDVGGNNLRTLPDAISKLSDLERFWVFDNALNVLPLWIGEFKKLSELDASKNRLREISEDVLRGASLTKVNFFVNPLEEPPLKVAEAGLEAIRSYFKERRMAGSWVRRSTPHSLRTGKRSIQAVLETVVCIPMLMLIVRFLDSPAPLFSGAVFAPLLLMRTDSSVRDGLSRFSNRVKALRLRTGDFEIRPLDVRLDGSFDHFIKRARLVGALMFLGLDSIRIKFWTAFLHVWRWESWAAISRNYRHQLMCVDWHAAPELVPGAEDAYNHDKTSTFTASDLEYDFTEDPLEDEGYMTGRPGRNPTATAIGKVSLFLFLGFARLYRFTLKMTALLYWPFVLVARFNTREKC